MTSSSATGAYLKSSNAEAGDSFAESVAIDGDVVLVGARQESSAQRFITNGPAASTDNDAAIAGAVYAFTRRGTLWTQAAFIKAPNHDAGDWMGRRIGISGDTMIVGADGEDSNQTTVTNGTTASSDNSIALAGAAYINQ